MKQFTKTGGIGVRRGALQEGGPLGRGAAAWGSAFRCWMVSLFGKLAPVILLSVRERNCVLPGRQLRACQNCMLLTSHTAQRQFVFGGETRYTIAPCENWLLP